MSTCLVALPIFYPIFFLDKEGLALVPLKKPPQHKFTDHGEHAKVQPESQVLSTTYYKFHQT
jgi:hypothetical protein